MEAEWRFIFASLVKKTVKQIKRKKKFYLSEIFIKLVITIISPSIIIILNTLEGHWDFGDLWQGGSPLSSPNQNLFLHGWSHWSCLSLRAVQACRSQRQPQSLPQAPIPLSPWQDSSSSGKFCLAIFCWCFMSAGKVKRAGKTEKKAPNNFLPKEGCLESVQIAHMSIAPLVKVVWVIIESVILHLSLWLLWAELHKSNCSWNAHKFETAQDPEYVCPAFQRSPPPPAHSTELHTSPSVPSAPVPRMPQWGWSSFPQPSPALPSHGLWAILSWAQLLPSLIPREVSNIWCWCCLVSLAALLPAGMVKRAWLPTPAHADEVFSDSQGNSYHYHTCM